MSESEARKRHRPPSPLKRELYSDHSESNDIPKRSRRENAAVAGTPGPSGPYYLRLRGLPFQASKKDVIEFFEGKVEFYGTLKGKSDVVSRSSGDNCGGNNNMMFYYNPSELDGVEEEEEKESAIVFDVSQRSGRVTGDAFVAIKSREDLEKALSLHEKRMGSRFMKSSSVIRVILKRFWPELRLKRRLVVHRPTKLEAFHHSGNI